MINQLATTANKPSRRKFIQGFSALMGVSAATLLTPKAVAVAMSYQPNVDSSNAEGKVFSQFQLSLLKQLCALVIPKTDTLGAAEVDTHGFIDNQMFHCYSLSEQLQIHKLLQLIQHHALLRHNTVFDKQSQTLQLTLLNDIEQTKNGFTEQNRLDIKFLKTLICFGYYTSEVGGSQELTYDALPGGFKGSVPFKPGEQGEGALAFY